MIAAGRLARSGGGGLVLTDSATALEVRAELPETRESSDTLALVEAGVLRGLSLEFQPLAERMEGGVRVLVRARLGRGFRSRSASLQGEHGCSAGRSRAPEPLAGVDPVSLRTWWESRAESTPTDYTNMRIAEAYQLELRRKLGVRGSAATSGAQFYRGSPSDSDSRGRVTARIARAARLGSIARALTDRGEAVFELRMSGDGKLALLPATIATVSGGADPADWSYLLTRSGPTESTSIQRPAGAVVAFVAHSDTKTPWRGRGRLEAAGTGALLASIETQMASESRFKPARTVSIGSVKEQRTSVAEVLAEGGIVAVSGSAQGSKDQAYALGAGVIKNESTAALVTLHQNLSAQISAAMGVPPDLLGATASEAGTRESFRRFSASTCSALIEVIRTEWALKVGPLEIGLDTLRAGDIAARARAVGSRSVAFKNLVAGGVLLIAPW